MSAEAVAIVGVGVALLAVLVPLLLAHGRRIDALAADVAELQRNLHAVGERVAHVEAGIANLDARTARLEAATLAYGERVARIEGALTGPCRPTNGPPAPAPQPATGTTETAD